MKSQLRTALPFFGFALVAWVGGVAWQRHLAPDTTTTRAPWQHVFTELPVEAQRTFRMIREGLLDAENARAQGAWPSASTLAHEGVPPFDDATLTWELRTHGLYATYLGLPKSGAGPRWLVLFIEPDPRTAKEQLPPEDEEHHVVGGLSLHVTVWTQPNEGPLPEGVLAFPVAEGWTQVVGR